MTDTIKDWTVTSVLSILNNMSMQKNSVKPFTVNIYFLSALSKELVEKYFSENDIDICCDTEIKSLQLGEGKLAGFKKFHKTKANSAKGRCMISMGQSFKTRRLLKHNRDNVDGFWQAAKCERSYETNRNVLHYTKIPRDTPRTLWYN